MLKIKRSISIIIISVFIQFMLPLNIMAEVISPEPFTDVPVGHWAYECIHMLRSKGITIGVGDNQFGLGKTISRSEFTKFLVSLMEWELIYPEKGSFADNLDTTKWYFSSIETALNHGVIIKDSEMFRVDDSITREEMAVMIVRALDYDVLAKSLTDLPSPFSDVTENKGYIIIAKDFGIISGMGNGLFKPNDSAKREEAAAMMIRMVDKLENKIDELHAFYAISSSSQMELIPSLNSVGFGWSRLEYDMELNQVVLNFTTKNNNEYAFPEGFTEPLNLALESKVTAQLMVHDSEQTVLDENTGLNIPLVEYILTTPEARKQVIDSICSAMAGINIKGTDANFDGVIIDFEYLGQQMRQAFNDFLTELKPELVKNNKKLIVMVHPVARPGQTYFDGYDYKTIGETADKVILMAHDYYAKILPEELMEIGYTLTPLTPFNDFYYALKSITDRTSGVQDLNKVLVQISIDSVQWKLKEGKVIHIIPLQPGYEDIQMRLAKEDTIIDYFPPIQNPRATYYNPEDETDNVIWYEDARSVQAKLDLMKMFGIQGISLWRLGIIPDFKENSSKSYLNVWELIQNMKK